MAFFQIFDQESSWLFSPEEGREKIKRKQEEINEKLARDMEKRMMREAAKTEEENNQKGGHQGGSPHR